jgi:hypothetical protein
METTEVKQWLQRFFNGESSDWEEQQLKAYFQSGNVADELREYAEFFGGISELAATSGDSAIEEEVMNYILENENRDKKHYLRMWKTVTGIAASVIIVLGSVLFFEHQQKPVQDTFDDPDQAYAYAVQTLSFVSSKYNKGLAQLAQFDKLSQGSAELKKGLKPVNAFFDGIEKVKESDQRSVISKQ